MAKFHGSKQMYKDSPKLERDEHGKMGVSKPAEQSGKDEADEGMSGEPVHHEVMARHNLERHLLHSKHEHEHAMHKHGDKKEMHKRHHEEHGEMLKKHDAEIGSGEEGEE